MSLDFSKPIEVVWGDDKKPATPVKFSSFRFVKFATECLRYNESDGRLYWPSEKASQWRVRNVPEKPAPKPYTAETWPAGLVWLRGKFYHPGCRDLVTSVTEFGVHFDDDRASFDELTTGFQLSTDGGKTWRDCVNPD